MSKAIYSFPDFKEPEKTTRWTDRDAANDNAAPAMRDHEAIKREKRTRLIKERMSPPEVLKLTARLERMRQRYLIPDGAFKSQATFDRIYVYPIDPFDDAEKIPGSFLFRANLTRMKDMQEGHRGVLISAGLTAMDRLASHGYELGDIVTTNKNVPFARRCEVIEEEQLFYLVMRDGDLAGNESLMERIRAGERIIADAGDEFTYEHQLADADGHFKKKQSAYVNDTW